jgi:hypothetical protein
MNHADAELGQFRPPRHVHIREDGIAFLKRVPIAIKLEGAPVVHHTLDVAIGIFYGNRLTIGASELRALVVSLYGERIAVKFD